MLLFSNTFPDSISNTFFFGKISAFSVGEVRKICLQAFKSWENIGESVEEACPDFSRAEEIFQTLRALMFLKFSPLLNKHRDQIKPEIIWNIEKGIDLTGEDINRAEQMRADLYYSTLDFFQEYDLLVCPAAVAPPFDVNIRYLEELDGIKFDTYISWLAPTFAVTLTTCPCISLPCGFTDSGLPVGIQIVGPPRREDRLLSAAAIFEEQNALPVQTPIDPR